MSEDRNSGLEIDIVDHITADLTIPFPQKDKDTTRDIKFRLKFRMTEQTPTEQERLNKVLEDGGMGALVEDRLISAECLTPNQVFKNNGDVVDAREYLCKSIIGQQWVIQRFREKVNFGIKAKN